MSPPNRRVASLALHLATASVDPPQMPTNLSYEGPLKGYRVLDLSQMVSGPMGTQILGDQGAEIVKVEGPDGAAERGSSRSRMLSPLFSVVNRSKRSCCLDLKHPDGKRTFLQLVERWADVVVQNFRPGVIERMGLGFDDLKRINPRIILVSISGFGETGPYSQKRVYDPIIQATSGLASIQADATGRPRLMRLIIPDKVTALTSAQAVTAALLQRHRTGEGCHVQLSMLDAVVSFAWAEGFAQETFIDESIVPNYAYSQDLVFKTTDGYITCGAVQDKEWRALCMALRKPEWIDDPRFSTARARSVNRDERVRRLSAMV